MAISNLTGQKTYQSFRNLMQISSSGQVFDGLGNLVTSLQLTASFVSGSSSGGGSGAGFPYSGAAVITGSLTVSGSSTFTNIGPAIFSGSVTSTQGITGSLFGTSSFATSASFAVSSSRAVSSSFATSASFAVSSSRAVSSSFATTASYAISSSFAVSSSNTQTASYVTPLNQTVTINGSLLQGLQQYDNSYTYYSHLEGYNTQAQGSYSHAEGLYAQTTGQYSHAEGGGVTIVGGPYSLTAGNNLIATLINNTYITDLTLNGTNGSGNYVSVTAIGNYTGSLKLNYGSNYIPYTLPWISANYYQDEGYTNYTADFGIVDNQPAPVIYSASYSGGVTTFFFSTPINSTNYETGYQAGGLASGFGSHAEGQGTQAQGQSSHAEGYATQAVGVYSHAEGIFSQANGGYSHAEGYNTQAIGQSSHAEGNNTIALVAYQHVQGQYNMTSSVQSAFIHGNGIDANNRSNLIYAHDNVVEITGSLKVSGSATITGNLTGTASYATQAVSASFATRASNSQTASYVNPLIQNVLVTGSLLVTGSNTVIGDKTITGSLIVSSSNATQFLVGNSNLFVSSSGNTLLGRLSDTGTNTDRLQIETPAGYGIGIGFGSTNIFGRFGYVGGGSNDTFIGSISNNNFRFYSVGTEKMRLTTTGNLGIGTTTPNAKLDISGSVNISGSGTQVPLQITSGSTSLLFVSSSGNVGIGTITPIARLSVIDTTLASGSNNIGSVMDLQQTWNTTGYPITFRINVTNTASGYNAVPFQYQLAGTPYFSVTKDGYISFGNPVYSPTIGTSGGITAGTTLGGKAIGLFHYLQTEQGYGIFASSVTGTRTATSNECGVFKTIETFNPSSGTATYNGITLANIISQSGASNGITRGLYINPNLSASVDFRAIEATSGSIVFPYTTAAATYSIKTSDYLVNFTTAGFTASLATAVGCTGKTYILKNSAAGQVVVATTSAQTIDGASTYTLSAQYKYVQVVSNGANWIITGNN